MPKANEHNEELDNELENQETELENEDGIVIPEEEEVPDELSDEDLTRLMNTSDAKLKSMGIDDPKQWKNYQRFIAKQQKEWKAKEAQYQSELSRQGNEFEQIRGEIEKLRTPPAPPEPELVAPVPPMMPEMPEGFNLADASLEGSVSHKYWIDKMKFDKLQHDYVVKLQDYNSKVLGKVQRESDEFRQRAIQQQNMNQMKADAIAKMMKARPDMTAQLAEECWHEATANAKNFWTPEAAADLFMSKKGKPAPKRNVKSKGFDTFRNNRETYLPPGVGGKDTYTPKPGDYSKSSSTKWMYDKKK